LTSDVLAQLFVGMGLFAAAGFMWWFIPHFTDWITPGEPLWMIWIQKAIGAAVFAIPAGFVIVGAFN
jgi:hypothetical protein